MFAVKAHFSLSFSRETKPLLESWLIRCLIVVREALPFADLTYSVT